LDTRHHGDRVLVGGRWPGGRGQRASGQRGRTRAATAAAGPGTAGDLVLAWPAHALAAGHPVVASAGDAVAGTVGLTITVAVTVPAAVTIAIGVTIIVGAGIRVTAGVTDTVGRAVAIAVRPAQAEARL
jgi:hypothetical protein